MPPKKNVAKKPARTTKASVTDVLVRPKDDRVVETAAPAPAEVREIKVTKTMTKTSRAKRAAGAPAKTRATAAASKYYIVIDYPQEGETVSGLLYSIRIGASEAGRAEISINGNDWTPCRQDAGYWWYDWGYFTPGEQKIVARLVSDEGKVLKKSDVRTCEVV